MQDRFLLRLIILSIAFAFGMIGVAAGQKREPRPVAEVTHEGPVDFELEILPILRANCVACHNESEAEGDLVVETPQAMLVGGSEGPAVVPGNAAKSLLFQSAAHQIKPAMPPKKNKVDAVPLSPEELGLLKLWIDQGASGEVTGQSGPAQWQLLPPRANPIYAVAISPDGQYAACGRANQVSVYHVPSGRALGRLTDPELLGSEPYGKAGVSHLDLVQSLAFSPDGRTLASGGFRTAKLWRRQGIEKIADLPATEQRMTAMAVSPVGKLCALGQASGAIALVDLASGKTLRSLDGHRAEITGLAFSPDATTLYSGSADKSLRAWEVDDGSATGQVENAAPVTAIALVSGASQIAVASADHTIRIWSLAEWSKATSELIAELKGHTAPVTSLAVVEESGTQIISGSLDGTLRHWDLATGKEVRHFNHGGPITGVAAGPDGERFVSVSGNNTGKLWDATDGKQLAELKGDFRVQLQSDVLGRLVEVAKQSVDLGKKAISGAKGNVTKIERETQKAIDRKATVDKELAALIEKAVKPAADKVAANKALADQKLAVRGATAGATDQATPQAAINLAAEQRKLEQLEADAKTADAADLRAQRAVVRHQGWASDAALLIPLKRKMVEDAADKVTACEGALGAVEQALKQAEADRAAAMKTATQTERPYRTVAFSADGQQLAIAGDDGKIHLYDSAKGAAIDTLDAHAAAVSVICYTPRGQLISAADKTVTHWNPNGQWQLARTIGNVDDATQLVDRVTALTFSPDGKTLATGSGQPSRSGQLKLWSVADGALMREVVHPHSDTILGLDFSPRGDRIVSASADHSVKIFRVDDGSFLRVFEGHTHHVLGVSWKFDGRLIASCGADNVIKIWDLEASDKKKAISVHKKEVTAISFVGYSDELLSSSGDRQVGLHRAENGGKVRSFDGATDFLYSAAASDDGRRIIAGGEDSVLRVWDGTNGKSLYQFEPEGNGK